MQALVENEKAKARSGKFSHAWPLPAGAKRQLLGTQAPALAEFNGRDNWPGVEEYTCLARRYCEAALGFTLNFIDQPRMGKRQKRASARYLRSQGLTHADNYVNLIVEKKEVLTKAQDWHDFFNLISWTQFPKTRWQLHVDYYLAAQQKAAGEKRSVLQDRIVLFDEGGLLLVVEKSQEELALTLIKSLDLSEKAQLFTLLSQKDVFIFGHGLCESYFANPIPVNAFTILQPVDAEFFSLPVPEKLAILDEKLFQIRPWNEIKECYSLSTHLIQG